MGQLSLFEQNESEENKVIWSLYVDGASRNNPGPAGAGIYILKNAEPFLKKGYYLGTMTNNQAEYNALLLGLFLIDPLWQESDKVHIFADSQLMIRQLQGEYKVVKPTLKVLYQCAVKWLQHKSYSLTHIMREENSIADLLANEGINKKIQIPDDFQHFCIP